MLYLWDDNSLSDTHRFSSRTRIFSAWQRFFRLSVVYHNYTQTSRISQQRHAICMHTCYCTKSSILTRKYCQNVASPFCVCLAIHVFFRSPCVGTNLSFQACVHSFLPPSQIIIILLHSPQCLLQPRWASVWIVSLAKTIYLCSPLSICYLPIFRYPQSSLPFRQRAPCFGVTDPPRLSPLPTPSPT